MISMTGFGRGELQVGGRTFRVEARSVNNRFLDLKVRLPWIDGELESRTIALVRRAVTRGRVEISVLEERGARPDASLHLDEALARSVGAALQRLAGLLGADLATAARLLPPLKELVGTDSGPIATDDVWPALERGLQEALGALTAMRRREGEALAADVAGHLQRLREAVARIRTLAAGEPERARRRLQDRLSRLLGDSTPVDAARLAEEVALIADRADVSEELARLESHFEQLQGMLEAQGEVGRRFEFMLQELHRELNTIASKTDSAETAHLVVDAKASVERMREQAQNVE
jgi:uncharacterized protein (TIGR00255 family)